MGQFKPMAKMETTEPSVILKLKKGGHVAMPGKAAKKMDGGAMGAMAAAPRVPAVAPAGRAPARPSLAERRRAMMAAKAMAAPAMAKKGGKMESKAEHAKEATKAELEAHADKPASKAHKGLKTGGVVKGQGGFKKGGMAKRKAYGGPIESMPSQSNAGGAMRGLERAAAMSGRTMPVTGRPSMLKTGGVAKGQGGYKKGGAVKKFAKGGQVQDDGRPEKMPQGSKKPSAPVSISRLAGTFKKGGAVKKADGGSISNYERDLGRNADAQLGKETKGYEDHYKREAEENRAMREAMNPMNLVRKARDALKGQGAVTTTEREISRTVSPPQKKRRGGYAKGDRC